MVKCRILLPILLALVLPAVYGQSATDLERRVRELEEKMRVLDPSFGVPTDASLVTRLAALETKMNQLLEARVAPIPPAPPPIETVAEERSPTPGSPLQRLSVTGDYQTTADTEIRLPVAGYMDFHFNKFRQEPGEFDFHRFVLMFGHSFSDRIKFWSELEVEHSLVEGAVEKGEVALEQAYLDFLIKPWFNLRAGMLLTPVGLVNERHEPPAFNGVERPFVESIIIPTTWREMGFGATGDLGRGFRYRAYLLSGLDATGFDAELGIAEGRTSGFEASFRNPAKVARVEYTGLRRLALGTSIYSGHTGFNLQRVNPRVNIFSFDGRFSYNRFDLRGLVANTWISRAGELNIAVQRDFGVNPNVASQLRGAYLEPGVHILSRRIRHDMILFSRYEKYDTQHKMPQGFVPLPQFNRSTWVVGATYKPNADVSIKFDYNFNRNASSVVRAVDSFNAGIGWWF